MNHKTGTVLVVDDEAHMTYGSGVIADGRAAGGAKRRASRPIATLASVSGAITHTAGAIRGIVKVILRILGATAVRCWQPTGRTSLSFRNLRVHFDVAIALISVIPMLVFTYVSLFDPPIVVRSVVFAASFLLVVLGYWLLGRYPKTLRRLHDYLRRVANGEIPRVANLMEEEKDIVATERYLNLILEVMREKIRTIERQKLQIVEIERRKAIAESLATTCHYLGQPATVIVACLDMMKKEDLSPAMMELLSQCQVAGASITQMLHTLNEATLFRSEPYLPGAGTTVGKSGEKVLMIDGLSDGRSIAVLDGSPKEVVVPRG